MPSPVTAKWEPAVPIRKHDNLMLSPQFRHLKPFEPSYEKEKHIYMNYLMAWEYGRTWFEEKKKWEIMNYGSKSTGNKQILRRKRIQRGAKSMK